MKNVNIILAAGSQTRWNTLHVRGYPDVKQLVKIEDEILIERIQRQFPGSIVVTKNDTIKKHSKLYFEPENHEMTIATLYSTRDLWEDWTTILLGDVLYGRDTVKKIKRQKEPLMFYGNTKEIFAIKFNIEKSFNIIAAINKLIMSRGFMKKYGKLWNMYRVLNFVDFREHEIRQFFTFVYDCQDFDNKAQYAKYAKDKAV